MMLLYELPLRLHVKLGQRGHHLSELLAPFLVPLFNGTIEEKLMNRNVMSKGRLRESADNVLGVNAQTRFGGKNFLLVYNSCYLVL